MRTIHVVRRKSGKGWRAKLKDRTVARGDTKQETVKKAAKVAKNARKPTSLRIHGKDGRIQEERTYPRSADPRSSQG
jgi:hypothetical protein